jgi:hypothetical protein
MSDKPEGPGWWIASDGQWYPPELHPSVRDEVPVQKRVEETNPSQSPRWQPQADKSAHVGPQFPDLFQKALEGSHLVDNISVNYAGDDDRRSTPRQPVGSAAGGSGSGGSTGKRKWRKGH